jgi:hypothetical protein
MIELVVAVCMIDQPATCKDVHLSFEAQGVSTHQCLMQGQFEMAKWIGEHPDWSVHRWKCQPAGQVAKI